MDDLGQTISYVFCPHFLNQPDHAADQQHTQDNQHCGRIAAEIGGEKYIRNKRNTRQHKQDDSKWIDKSSAQTVDCRIGSPSVSCIAAVLFAVFCSLFLIISIF